MIREEAGAMQSSASRLNPFPTTGARQRAAAAINLGLGSQISAAVLAMPHTGDSDDSADLGVVSGVSSLSPTVISPCSSRPGHARTDIPLFDTVNNCDNGPDRRSCVRRAVRRRRDRSAGAASATSLCMPVLRRLTTLLRRLDCRRRSSNDVLARDDGVSNSLRSPTCQVWPTALPGVGQPVR